jgi:hypothetical protein
MALGDTQMLYLPNGAAPSGNGSATEFLLYATHGHATGQLIYLVYLPSIYMLQMK